LAGTLTYPKTRAPFAAVLLLTGSGPQDRDEAIMGHRPFLVLSDYLTRLGFAVLRADDRRMGKSSGDFSKATYDHKVADGLAGFDLLRTRKEIDGRRIGLLGHSEGGAIAEMAASRSKDIAFIVMMAGPGVPGDQLMKQQGIDIVRANGGGDAAVKQQVVTQSKIFQILREEKDPSIAEKRIRETLGSLPGAEQQARAVVSPTIRDLSRWPTAKAPTGGRTARRAESSVSNRQDRQYSRVFDHRGDHRARRGADDRGWLQRVTANAADGPGPRR
jgi:pimeloyl-ACP methyl ester carboxylesterase